ncbi:MAG: TonB-dependent receptor [Ignavibacteria bacterium]|nr:TonB-dependent receptor [Ignavibacteria bacterium]
MSKNYFFGFLFLFFTVSILNAQDVTVNDKNTMQPIANVTITNLSNNEAVWTNELGKADIRKFQGADRISFFSPDFARITYSYSEIEKKGFMVYLSPKSYSTDEIVVSADKFGENLANVPRQIDVINSRDIEFENKQTTARLLENTGNVFVQMSQQGGGSPVLRGFEANRVLIMIDGIRLNNAIFRGGHLQNIIRIDQSMLSRMEVMYGAGSTLYGSDALGGVMSFYTKSPLFSGSDKTLYKVSTNSRYSSVNSEATSHLDVNIGLKNIAFLTSLSFSSFGDLMQGKEGFDATREGWKRKYYVARTSANTDVMIKNPNAYLQTPSGYYQYDIMQKIAIKGNESVSHLFNFQYSNTNDIPRYDRLNTLNGAGTNYTNAEWYYGPEKRLMGSYTLGLKSKSGMFDASNIILSYQNIGESRNSRSFNGTTLKSQIEKVNVYSLNWDLKKMVKQTHDISYGVEGSYNDVNSTAQRYNINTAEITPADTRYPSAGSNMMYLAGYITDNWKLSPNVFMNIGARVSYVKLKADFSDTTFYKFPFKEANQSNVSPTGNLGFVFKPSNDFKIYVNGSTGFRAPNIDDVAKVFESVKGSGNTLGRIIVPNPDLKPEYTINGELGFSKIFNNVVKVDASGYYTILNDAIVSAPFTYNGSSQIVYDGTLANVYAYQNVQKAYLVGGNFSINADFSENVSFMSTINYTYARVKADTNNYPLDHIPPVFGKSGWIFTFDKFKTDLNVVYNLKKKLEDYSPSGEDNLADATVDGMPGWWTLNLRTGYQVTKSLNIQFDVENILDQNYRVFASGISAPGRNFVFSLKGNF